MLFEVRVRTLHGADRCRQRRGPVLKPHVLSGPCLLPSRANSRFAAAVFSIVRRRARRAHRSDCRNIKDKASTPMERRPIRLRRRLQPGIDYQIAVWVAAAQETSSMPPIGVRVAFRTLTLRSAPRSSLRASRRATSRGHRHCGTRLPKVYAVFTTSTRGIGTTS